MFDWFKTWIKWRWCIRFESHPEIFLERFINITWIQRNDNWGTFVGNRVRRILHLTAEWRHVPGVLNLADLAGCNPKELLETNWWKGPERLKLSENHWPENKLEFDEDEINWETSWLVCSDRFSSYASKVRVMAWIQRFCNNLKRKSANEGHLNPNQFRLSIQESRSAD